MITVACCWVKANVPYGVEYVERLQAMVARNLARPHRFVCLTDRPWLLPVGIESMPVLSPLPLPGWWSKIELFAKGRFDDRVLYLDLDTLIVDALDPIVDFDSSFALIPHAGTFQPRTHHQVVRRFNSSVMVWDAGVNTFLHERWTAAVGDRLWGDQDFIGEQFSTADLMPAEWFPRLSAIQDGPVPVGARVVLAKKPKPAEAAKRWPWVETTWRAA